MLAWAKKAVKPKCATRILWFGWQQLMAWPPSPRRVFAQSQTTKGQGSGLLGNATCSTVVSKVGRHLQSPMASRRANIANTKSAKT